MRAIAAAIVILAGSVLAAASVIAQETSTNAGKLRDAGLCGAVLIVGGLIFLAGDVIVALFGPNRPSNEGK